MSQSSASTRWRAPTGLGAAGDHPARLAGSLSRLLRVVIRLVVKPARVARAAFASQPIEGAPPFCDTEASWHSR
jgi:hypothetical protein